MREGGRERDRQTDRQDVQIQKADAGKIQALHVFEKPFFFVFILDWGFIPYKYIYFV